MDTREREIVGGSSAGWWHDPVPPPPERTDHTPSRYARIDPFFYVIAIGILAFLLVHA